MINSFPIKLSIIIPVFNEQSIVETYLSKIQSHPQIEIIVVDGQSIDQTVLLAQQFPVKVVISPHKGRGNQLNYGASIATGEILCFLHLDSQLPPNYLSVIENQLSLPTAIAGAFSLGIDASGWSFRLLETLVNWRSRFCSLPYGDQALFLKAETFRKMGGFAKLPIMEDYEFVQRLKKRGKIQIAAAKILTSSRRWQKLGIFKTTLINQMMIIGYYFKIDPNILARWYRSQK
ncbi:MAG: TIGR04283 family arsenosugar biosynthesis glycosyltransferase [Snowella sp.]|nr:TIGR04283 family arsenosugar biosynthesis glycosyltransferase [Snowella sp.]